MFTTIVSVGGAGLLLLFLEMFLPGLIAGVIGAGLLIIAVGMSYDSYGAAGGNVALVLALLASGVLWWWWANHFQNTRFGQQMTLKSFSSSNCTIPDLAALLGEDGTTLTPLRPAGTILVHGKKVDAMSDGEFIERGATIRVVRSQTSVVIVRRVA